MSWLRGSVVHSWNRCGLVSNKSMVLTTGRGRTSSLLRNIIGGHNIHRINGSSRNGSGSSVRYVSSSFPSGYVQRHIGPQSEDLAKILSVLEVKDLEEVINKTVPSHIRLKRRLQLPLAASEVEALAEFKSIMSQNQLYKSYIGQGYYNNLTPTVILRNIIENPSWYTPYTPYQAEIAQGRLEMLLNFQTMVGDLVGKPLCNASLLDEATSCAEAVHMAWSSAHGIGTKGPDRNTILVSENVHLQNIDVIKTRAEPLGIQVKVLKDEQLQSSYNDEVFGVLVQYPDTNGSVKDFGALAKEVHRHGGVMIAATDLLACTQLKPPGEWGADIVVGTSQRFGVPLGYGGPHAGFLATEEKYLRKMPGRIIGITRDSRGKPALRMTLQTREQHIRRDKATSNICTAQALLANVSAAYAIYHGPKGLDEIAKRVNLYSRVLAQGLKDVGMRVSNEHFFETVQVSSSKKGETDKIIEAALAKKINLRRCNDGTSVSISLDETTTLKDVDELLDVFSSVSGTKKKIDATRIAEDLSKKQTTSIPSSLKRESAYLTHPVFNEHHSETAMMRYLYSLERRDLGLNTAMIPLGSCTMKLNSATVMTPVTWPHVNSIHPFVPINQVPGYQTMLKQMEQWLREITGFDAVSLQPNSGAQGEYAGLMTIRAYQKAKGEHHRNICLIPTSAHGTNPASAAMVGWQVVPVKCDAKGNVDLKDLSQLAKKHEKNLAGVMVTYPSTHGVYEEGIRELCNIVHQHGGQVYMDGANLQAQVGFCAPADIGADVCHLNLHKTFCIPHGGGGPGMGPIGVSKHLAPFLPGHSVIDCSKDKNKAIGAVSGAPWSSASILPIPWMYIRMMGTSGLEQATAVSIASANYMAKRLEKHYSILYRGTQGYCAHEFIVDLKPLKKTVGVTGEDVAKRLMDYGFHAPTMSFPVPDTLMVEPTESEPLSELDRLCDALIQIRSEIKDVEDGKIKIEDSPLRHAPHTVDVVTSDNWDRKYSRLQAAVNPSKTYWPTVGRVDNVFGDKNPVCSCPTVEEMAGIQNTFDV